jgi:hypothetical protein
MGLAGPALHDQLPHPNARGSQHAEQGDERAESHALLVQEGADDLEGDDDDGHKHEIDEGGGDAAAPLGELGHFASRDPSTIRRHRAIAARAAVPAHNLVPGLAGLGRNGHVLLLVPEDRETGPRCAGVLAPST